MHDFHENSVSNLQVKAGLAKARASSVKAKASSVKAKASLLIKQRLA